MALQAVVGDAELHGADEALGAHDEVAETGSTHREEEELHCPGGLWVDQGVEEDDVANTAGVADCPEEADGAAEVVDCQVGGVDVEGV